MKVDLKESIYILLVLLFLLGTINIQGQVIDVYLHDGRTYYEKEFDAQMQMEQMELKKRAIDSAEQERQQRSQDEYDKRLEREVNQVYDLYYKALNAGIPDLVISGTCGMMYQSVYKHSHPLLQGGLEKIKNNRIQEIRSKIPKVNYDDAELDGKGAAIFASLACAKKGGDSLRYYEPIVREMYTEIKGLIDNQATRDPSFGGTVYRDWNNFYSQMKGATLTPLTPTEKEEGKVASADSQKRFQALLKEAKAAGVSNKSIEKAFIPLAKKIDTTWGGFDVLVKNRKSEFDKMVLAYAQGNESKVKQVLNNQDVIDKINSHIESQTVVWICISDFPKSQEIRKPAEEALNILIKEAKINGGDSRDITEDVALMGDDLENLKKVDSMYNDALANGINWSYIAQKLAPIYDDVVEKSGEAGIKIKGAFTKAYDSLNEQSKDNPTKPTKESLVAVAKGIIVRELWKQNLPEGAAARYESLKVLSGIRDEKEQLASYKAKLDAQDQTLFKALGISTNNPIEINKAAVYFIGKLAPYYNDFKTNGFYPIIENANKEYLNLFVLSSGSKNYDEFLTYCQSNSISINDIRTYINGEAVNQAAYFSAPVSDYAREKYTEASEACLLNPATFYSTPYENWDTFSIMLQKERAYEKNSKQKK